MSGFLGRLLARSREGVHDVRPRLPGRFEPARNEPDRFAPATEIVVRSENDSTSGPRPDRQIARHRSTRDAPQPQPVHRGKLTQEEPLAPQHTGQRAFAPPAVPRPQHNTTFETARPGRTARAEEPERTRESHRIPAQPDVRSQHPVRTTPTEPRSVETMPRTRAKESGRNAETPTEPVIASERRAETRAERPARPVTPRPAPKDEESSNDEPVIRIHIGRIDVRAIQEGPPNTAATPTRPQPKRLTLEEYARERGRGER
jgi:hypothetical protein